jgi:hypothetical protein
MRVHRTMLVLKDSGDVSFAFYHYNPSMGAAVLFILLFISTTWYHIIQMFKSRTWFFIPFVMGGIGLYPPNIPGPPFMLTYLVQSRLSDTSDVPH